MNSVALIFLASGTIALALTTLTIWARRGFWLRAAGLALGGAFLVSAYVSLLTLLSLPKPVSVEWWGESQAEVLSGHLVEGEGIYLWLMFPGAGEPRYYVMPWDRQAAEELRQALEQREGSGIPVMMGVPGNYEPTLDDREPLFYPMPQEAAPRKEEPTQGPQVFEQPASAEIPPDFLAQLARDLTKLRPPRATSAEDPRQKMCVWRGPREKLVELLLNQFGEKQVHTGLASNGTVLEIFVSEDGSTWTAAITRPDGQSCMLGDGRNWVSAPVWGEET